MKKVSLYEPLFGTEVVLTIIGCDRREKEASLKRSKNDNDMSFKMKNKFMYGFKKKAEKFFNIKTQTIINWCKGMNKNERSNALYTLFENGYIDITINNKVTERDRLIIKEIQDARIKVDKEKK